MIRALGAVVVFALVLL